MRSCYFVNLFCFKPNKNALFKKPNSWTNYWLGIYTIWVMTYVAWIYWEITNYQFRLLYAYWHVIHLCYIMLYLYPKPRSNWTLCLLKYDEHLVGQWKILLLLYLYNTSVHNMFLHVQITPICTVFSIYNIFNMYCNMFLLYIELFVILHVMLYRCKSRYNLEIFYLFELEWK